MNSWIKYFLLTCSVLTHGHRFNHFFHHPKKRLIIVINNTPSSQVHWVRNKTLTLKTFLQENLDLLYL